MSRRRAPAPPRLITLALPALTVREAEVIIDCLEQLQGELWQAYRESLPSEEKEAPDDTGDPSLADSDDSLF